MYDCDKHDDFEAAICKCGEMGEYDACPYDQDVRGKYIECECCDECRNICCQDI